MTAKAYARSECAGKPKSPQVLVVVFSTALFKLSISVCAFLIKSPMVSFVGTAAPNDNATAF
jgi:hypothetical protein